MNASWKNQSFHNYANYAVGGHFHFGFNKLRELRGAGGLQSRAENVRWRCTAGQTETEKAGVLFLRAMRGA